jgi:hypothetical protein
MTNGSAAGRPGRTLFLRALRSMLRECGSWELEQIGGEPHENHVNHSQFGLSTFCTLHFAFVHQPNSVFSVTQSRDHQSRLYDFRFPLCIPNSALVHFVS